MKKVIAKTQGVSPKQVRAIELLAAAQNTDAEVCNIVGVSANTLLRWKGEPDFCKTVISRARELLSAELPNLYRIGVENASENAAYFKAVLDHIEKLENKLNPLEEITIRWK